MSSEAGRARTRVLIYAENYLAGGTERCLFELANHLDRDRFAVSLWVNRNPQFGHGSDRLAEDVAFRQIPILAVGPLFDWLAGRGWSPATQTPFKIVFLLVRYPFFLFNMLLLSIYLLGAKPDILQVVNGGYPGGESCQAAVLAGRLTGVSAIFFYGLNTPFPLRIPLAEHLVDALVARSLKRMVFNSEAACALMSRFHHVSPRNLACIHSARSVVVPTAEEIAAARQWIGAPAGRRLIGEIAGLERRKGQHVLLQAARSVLAAVPDAHFVIIGDGENRERLEVLTRELGLDSRVTFTGFYAGNVYALTAALDVVVLPSFQEGLPYTIQDAMAMGKPIVATTVGGVPEQVVDGESALLVPPGDVESLADALLRVLTDPALAARLGRNAQKRFSAQFSIEQMMDSFQSLYASSDEVLSPGVTAPGSIRQ